jgi:hypothetical protein
MDSTKNVAANFTAFASPSIAVAITGAANGQGNNERNYTLQLKNNGTGLGTACQITALSAATLVGNGNVNIKTKLPLAYGDLGTASKVIEANVPPKVQQFSLTAAGSCQNTAWQTVPFSTTMTVAR